MSTDIWGIVLTPEKHAKLNDFVKIIKRYEES